MCSAVGRLGDSVDHLHQVQLVEDGTAIGDAVDAAQEDPSAAALQTVRSTVRTLVDDVQDVSDEVGNAC